VWIIWSLLVVRAAGLMLQLTGALVAVEVRVALELEQEHQ
jgi:hypothetical protein